jgi:tetratricopeptide (TPR) repeat protein
VRLGPILALLLGLGGPGVVAAQDAATQALELERRGDFAGAAASWRGILASRPSELPALLGLERSLAPLGRLSEMTGLAAEAARREPSPGVFGVAIRVWTAARQPDSARAATERWAALEPGSEMPFQELGIAAYGARDRVHARGAYLLGRQLLGRPDAMAAELGQLAAADGDYATAAEEWTLAMRRVPGYRGAAISVLSQVPASGRAALLRELGRRGELLAESVAASLQARWGEPLAGVKRLEAALPARGSEAVDALQELLEELRGNSTPELWLARATALELLGNRSDGPQRPRLDAAQAFADGGDQASARRMLAALAGDRSATATMAASAASTLVSVLVDEGGLVEADRRFSELAPLLGDDDRERLALRLAQGWIHHGRLGRADTLLAADSSVDAQAVRGRIALYRGDLTAARAMLTEAGPFTGDRVSATERIVMLGLLQVIEEDSRPALGEAFYQRQHGDSAAAAAGFERLAMTLPPEHGGAELLLLAGRLRAGQGQSADAERLFRAAVIQGVPAGSAAAEFALADLLVRGGQKDQAIVALEHLLLTWPTSAVVPQARRLLDAARGAVPGG